MLYFSFVTDNEKISIHRGSKYVPTKAEGLNNAEVTGRTVQYIDTDGAEMKDLLYGVRTPSITGFIDADNAAELQFLKRKLLKAMNGKTMGKLYYRDGNTGYFAEARALFPEFGEALQCKQPFVLYFEIPHFYWQKEQERRHNLYKLTNLIGSGERWTEAGKDENFNEVLEFKLPCLLSKRNTEANVINRGDAPADCIIVITAGEANNSPADKPMLDIRNTTTGQYLTLNHAMQPGEVVKINTGECTVTSSTSGNIINKLFERTEADEDEKFDFWSLAIGSNYIKVDCDGMGCTVTATLSFYEQYITV